MKKLLMSLAVLMFSFQASAYFVLSPGVSYLSSETEHGSPTPAFTSELSEMRIDARLGYVLPMGLYVGGMYSHSDISSGSTDLTATSMGPSVGYYSMMGFYTILTYHILGEYGDGTDDLTGAKGPQVDVGWVFPLSAYFAIGPQLTWRSIDYDKLESSGVSQDADRNETSIAPYISLWFMF